MRYMRAFAQRAASEDGPITFVASTEDVARDGGVIEADGWQLDNFKANPVIQWAHQYSMPPIGRGLNPRVEDGQLLIDVEFDRDDPFAAEVERKVRAGFLNAASVGWDGKASEAKEGETFRFTQQDLLEMSIVPVPSDPKALAARQIDATRTLAEEFASILSGRELVKPGEFPRGLACMECDAEIGVGDEYVTRPLREGVVEVVCVPCGRAGAVLSGRNLERLQQAAALIGEVVDSAKKDSDPDRSGQEIAALRMIADGLDRLARKED